MYHEDRFFGFLKTKSHFPYIIGKTSEEISPGYVAAAGRIKGFQGKGMYAEWNRE